MQRCPTSDLGPDQKLARSIVKNLAFVPEGPAGHKVCVCGGAGGIGQPLALLLALDPRVRELAVQDVALDHVVPAQGVAQDLLHMEMPCEVKGYAIDKDKPAVEQLEECLTGCSLVLVPAGVPRKPGMTRDDLFSVNAGIARGLCEAVAKFCPNAVVALIVNPVNSVVPAICELYAKWGLDARKVVGVTTLDCVRANKFAAKTLGCPAKDLDVPVVGGHAGKTIVPLFSQSKASSLPAETLAALDARTQDAGTEVVDAKQGKGSATLSMAYAGARLAKAILRGLDGEPACECAFAKCTVQPGLEYFATKVQFGPSGVQACLPLGELSAHEQRRVEEAAALLKADIDKGVEWARQ